MTVLPAFETQDLLEDIRTLARPLDGEDDLAELASQVSPSTFICLGDASHATLQYYRLRAV